MSKANIEVKWFHSEMPDAPVLRGQAGALIELLDACLVNGFGIKTIDAITIEDGVATVAISSGHAFEPLSVIRIAGATPSSLNGDWRVDSATATALTFLCPDIADDSAAGAITAIRAPAGMVKPFSDTNIAAYRSDSPASTQRFLRVDDTDTMLVRVRGYEEMTDIDTMSGPFPTVAQVALANYIWRKSNAASSAARQWLLVSDGAFVYLSTAWSSTYPTAYDVVVFGDITPLSAADEYHCMVAAHMSTPGFPQQFLQFYNLASSAGKYLARSYTQIGGAIDCCLAGSIIETNFGRTSLGAHVYPSVVDGSLHLQAPVAVMNGSPASSAVIRGILPGAHQPLLHQPLQSKDILDPAADRPALIMMACAGSGASSQHRIALTISEAWR